MSSSFVKHTPKKAKSMIFKIPQEWFCTLDELRKFAGGETSQLNLTNDPDFVVNPNEIIRITFCDHQSHPSTRIELGSLASAFKPSGKEIK